MSDEKKNVAILRSAFDRWHDTKGGSIDHWLEIMDDNVDFKSLADGADGLEFTSRRGSSAGAADYLRGLVEQLEMIHYTVDEFIAQGDKVVAIGSTSWRNRQTGKSFDTPKVDVVRFKNGKIIEFFELYDTAQVLATSIPDG